MNDKWVALIKQLDENGYMPEDIQRIVMFYELMKETDDKLKKLYEDEKHECNN